MLELAEASDWDALAEVEVARKAVLELAFQPPVMDEQALGALAREVAELDQRIMKLAREGMVELRTALKTMQTGKQASLAYQSNDR